tara:strand:- start:1895 stop:2128 length:234 start_codon:yes stop_codon:yes gene_type:complete
MTTRKGFFLEKNQKFNHLCNMRILKNTIPLLALALFSFSSCNTTNGLQKRMKNKTKKKCDCPGWSMERVEENSPIIS